MMVTACQQPCSPAFFRAVEMSGAFWTSQISLLSPAQKLLPLNHAYDGYGMSAIPFSGFHSRRRDTSSILDFTDFVVVFR